MTKPPRLGRLVADDQVLVWPRAGRLMATAPAALAGKLEVRGLGIIEVESVHDIAVALVVDLVSGSAIERMPDDGQVTEIQNIAIPVISLAAFEAAACIKIALALARASTIFSS